MAEPIGSVYTTPRLCLPCGKDFIPERKVDRRLIDDYCSDRCRLKATRGTVASFKRQLDIFDRFEQRASNVGHETATAPRERPTQPIRMPVVPPDAPPYVRNLARERVRRGWSQQALADHIGVARQSIAYWETGQREPGIEQFAAIAQAFGIGLDDLWRDNGAVA